MLAFTTKTLNSKLLSKTLVAFFVAVVVLFIQLIVISDSSAQTKGLIVKPAIGAGKMVLDPNNDGYVSKTGTGFVANDYHTNTSLNESEIPYRPLPLPESEPMSDLARGPGGGFSDFADMNGTVYPVASYLSAANNFMFRFRLGGIAPNSKGYSILVDSDGLFGNSGTSPDPHYSADNPGFEFEIVLATNFAVRVYNVNNSTGTATALTTDATFPYEQHCQKAIAYTTNNNGGSTNGNPDYFYDFYLPFGSLQTLLSNAGITINSSTTGLRMVANTIMAPQSAIKGPISDMGGINDATYANPVNAWTKIVEGFVPTTAAGTTGSEFPAIRSNAPVITSAITTTSTSVSGTSTEAQNTVINVYKNGVLLTGTALVSATGTWTFNLPGGTTVNTNDIFTAYATAPNKSISLVSNEVAVGSSATCGTRTATPVYKNVGHTNSGGTGQCQKATGFTIGSVAAGTIFSIRSANNPGVLLTAAPYNVTGPLESIAAPGNEFWYKANSDYTGCNSGSGLADGIYYVTAWESGKCESLPLIYNTYTSAGSTCPSTTSLTVTETSISPQTTSLSGTTTAGTSNLRTGISIFVDDVYYTGTSLATGSAWSITGLVFKAGQVVKVYAQKGDNCMSNPVTFTVNMPVTTAPVISGPVYTTATKINGTSTEAAGTVITVRLNGAVLGTATVLANGTWEYTLAGGTTLNTSSLFTATALATNKSVSVTSNTVTVKAALNASPTAPVISLNAGVAYKEAGTTVQGTSVAGTRVRLYIDGVLLDSAVTDGSGNWSISTLNASRYDLYTDGVLTAKAVTLTSGVISSYESAASASRTVECNPPAAFTAVETAGPICAGEKELVTIENSQTGTIYTIKDNSTDAGTSTLGTGGTINLYSFALPTAASPYQKDFTVAAQNIYGLSCATTQSTSSAITVNPTPLTNLSVSAPANVPSGSTTSISIPNSQAGYVYALREGTTVVGTPASILSSGGSISFTTPAILSSRTFNVYVTDNSNYPSKLCSAELTATKTIGTNPLPVELISFTGKFVSNGTLLEWATATEKDNNYFDLERSLNGIEFTSIGRVSGHNNSTSVNRYNFTDASQLPGLVYYRLKQVDNDGTNAYSPVIALDRKGARLQNKVVVYPNPTADNCNLVITSAAVENATLIVYDAIGNEVKRQAVKLEIGQTEVPVETSALANGMYFISLTGKKMNEYIKLQKTSK